MQSAPPANTPDSLVRFLSRSLSRIRFDEVIVLQGPPLLGVTFALGSATLEKAGGLAVFLAASCCLVAHVFVLNDWSELGAGPAEPEGRKGSIANRGLDRRATGFLWMGLLVASLVLFSLLGTRTVALAAGISILSALYSAPAVHAKGIPVLNSLLHLTGGVLHFLLGYSLFRGVDRRGLEVALFFALTFVAGHLMQEVRDHDEDLRHRITTNAVRFGKRRAFAAGLAIFTLADGLLIVLAARGIVPRALLLVAGLYPLHLMFSSRAVGAGLTAASVRLLQWRYRALYAAIGVVMAAALLAGP